MESILLDNDLSLLPEETRKRIDKAIDSHRELQREQVRLKEENRLLREILRLLRIKKYGARSEALNDDQLELLDGEPSVEEAEVETEAALPAGQKQIKKHDHAGRNALPAHLPRKEEVIAVEEKERLCPCCGGERCVIGYEEKEELDLEPLKYFVRVVRREKLACRKCPDAGVVTAPVRAHQIIEKSKLSNAVIVDVLIKKYGDHLPLYRQQATLERDFGIQIARTTLCEAVMAVGGLLEPVAAVLKQDLFAAGYIQADETPIGVQSDQTQGRNHQGYAFQYSRPGGPVVFDFRMSRAREGPRNFLGNYDGILQYDGYAGYEKTGSSQMIRAGCWAHARRKFTDTLKLDPQNEDALAVVRLLARLYAVEADARERNLAAEQRLELRQTTSAALIEQLKAKMLEIKTRALPSSMIAKACNYTLGQWKKLTAFLDHSIIEIDQNRCENSMRPLALGRRNWLHFGSEEAGPKIAAILSLFETCKRLKINLRDYLCDVLPKLPDWPMSKVNSLTPSCWLASR